MRKPSLHLFHRHQSATERAARRRRTDVRNSRHLGVDAELAVIADHWRNLR